MVFARFRRLLVARPFSTNAGLAALMMCAGDRIAQHIEDEAQRARVSASAPAHEPPPPAASRVPSTTAAAAAAAAAPLISSSWQRSGVLASWGAISSLLWTGWYHVLHVRLPNQQVKWVLLTALLPAPALNAGMLAYCTALRGALAGAAADDVALAVEDKVRSRWLSSVVVSTQVWGPINLLNFWFMPREGRVLLGMSVAILWNVYLSIIAAAASGDDAASGNSLFPFIWTPRIDWPRGEWPRIVDTAARALTPLPQQREPPPPPPPQLQ